MIGFAAQQEESSGNRGPFERAIVWSDTAIEDELFGDRAPGVIADHELVTSVTR
jgi:hypothetical protein